jgi:hypothetical protein
VAHHGGQLIYHPDNRFRTTHDVLQKGDHRLAALIDKLTQGETGYGRYAFLGDERFLAYTSCKVMPWSVGITVLQGDLMADINRFQKKMLTFFGVIMLLILFISYLFIKGLTRPIKQAPQLLSRLIRPLYASAPRRLLRSGLIDYERGLKPLARLPAD